MPRRKSVVKPKPYNPHHGSTQFTYPDLLLCNLSFLAAISRETLEDFLYKVNESIHYTTVTFEFGEDDVTDDEIEFYDCYGEITKSKY